MRVFQDANGNGLYDAGEAVLADYAYDAFGRRVEFANVGAGTTTRYYHDGVRVIQERDAADNLVRSHVHGAQYLDEHVSTFESSGGRAGRSSYYLLGANFSVVGVGDADGSAVTRLEYSPAGDRVGPGGGLFFDADDDGDLDLADWVSLAGCLTGPTTATGPGCGVHDFTRDGAVDLADAAEFQRYFSGEGNPASPACRRAGSYAHDADGDGDVDIDDYLSYELCLTAPPDEPPDAVCLAFHDFDVAGESDGRVDLDDFGGLANCFRGPGQTPPPECFRPAPAGEVPGSGSFALHGSMVDVLSGGRGPGDELALQYSRARYFDLKHGRFLQRDPKGYIDGANLYEAFASNPARFTDPMGTGLEPTETEFSRTWLLEPVSEKALQEYSSATPEFLVPVMEAIVGVGKGVTELTVEFGVGIYTMIRHPIDTASGIGESAATTYNNARTCGDGRVVAGLQTAAAGAASVAGLGEVLIVLEEPGTTQENAKHITKGAVQLALIVIPAAKAGAPGKAGAVANTLDDVGRAGVKSVDKLGRAAVNLGEDAARAAEIAPAGAVPPAIGEQLLFPFMREDAALVAPARSVAVSGTAITARVGEIHGVLDAIAGAHRTTAIAETTTGLRVIAGGARDLTPAQRAMLGPGEVAAEFAGAHAEVTALRHISREGLLPARLVASRPFCLECVQFIESTGGVITSPTTAVWPR